MARNPPTPAANFPESDVVAALDAVPLLRYVDMRSPSRNERFFISPAAGVFSPDCKLTGDPAAGAVFRKARPADAIQLYATGLIRQPAGVQITPQTVAGVTVKVGDISITPDFAGLQAVGEFQVNFRVPQQFSTLPEGDYPISVQVKLDDGAVTSSPETINSGPPGPIVLPIQH